MSPITGDIRRGLHMRSQRAQETVLCGIDYDSHVTAPDYDVPGYWLEYALEFLYPPIKSVRSCILVMKSDALIQ